MRKLFVGVKACRRFVTLVLVLVVVVVVVVCGTDDKRRSGHAILLPVDEQADTATAAHRQVFEF